MSKNTTVPLLYVIKMSKAYFKYTYMHLCKNVHGKSTFYSAFWEIYRYASSEENF